MEKVCDIFICYRGANVILAKNFAKFIRNQDKGPYGDCGKVWYSDFEPQGDYSNKDQLRSLIFSASYFVVFIYRGFTEGFLLPDGRINPECATAQEFIFAEMARQQGNLEFVFVNMNGEEFSSEDIARLETLFSHADVLRDDTILFFTKQNKNNHDLRQGDDEELYRRLLGGMTLPTIQPNTSRGASNLSRQETKAASNPIVSALMGPILNRQEDNAKLTNNYEGLCLRYYKTKNLIRYDNAGKPDEAQVLKLYGKKDFLFPVTYDYALSGLTIEIADSQKSYVAPGYISAYRDELIAAHNHSTVYNNLNIRIDNWYLADRQLHVETSRTSYFDSLVTNRAMDYKLPSGVSIRDTFEYMPQISPLKKSVLSNHIGFNGFVESSDGYIPFVKRSSTVSIGKRTTGTSVGASLKTKYALNEEGAFNIDGLLEAVRCEIFDELGISAEGLEPFSGENHHIIAAYRDLVEGGKPQFLVYVKSLHTKQEIEALFYRNNQEKVKQMLADGKQLVWVPREELKNLCITPASVIFKGTVMKMVPSAAASIIMLLDYLANL